MKSITVRDKNNNTYTLTFTAETVKMLDTAGFYINGVYEHPMTYIPMLFEGAFLAKEANKVTSEDAMAIYQAQRDKTKLLQKLIELYNDPINEVIVKEGNVEWECNF